MKGYVFSTKPSTPRSISKLMLIYKICLKPQGLPAGCLRSPSWLGKETPFSHDPAWLPSCPTSFYQYKGWHCLQGATQITVPSSCIAPDPNPAPGCPRSALPACTETSAAAAAWQRWVWSWGWPWMHFKRQCRRSVRITWNDYFRADFPLKKRNSSTCAQFDLHTKDLYKNSLLSVSYKKKACWQDLGKCAG